MTTRIDKQIIDLLDDVIQNGNYKEDRTSVGSNLSVFGRSFHYDCSGDKNYVAFMQCRTFSPRIAFEELMWMLRGQVDVKILQDKNIKIWDGNSSVDYLRSINKEHIEPNTIGKGYGYQMRNMNGVDQLVETFNGLKSNAVGRRHVISLWNPADFNDMALEPCHNYYGFYSDGKRLCLHQQMRSNDVFFGNPYNVAFSTMWMTFFALALGLEVGELFFTVTDAHVYTNQIDAAKETIKNYRRLDKEFTRPYITVKKELTCLEDILSLEWEDIEVHNWERGNKIGNAKMAV